MADDRVSRRHAVVTPTKAGWVYEDLASANGSYADGVRIHRLAVRGSKTIRLGNASSGPPITLVSGGRVALGRPPASVAILAVLGLTAAFGVLILGTRATPPPAAAVPPPTASPTVTPAPTRPPSRSDIVAQGKSGTVRIDRASGNGSGAYLGGDLVLTAAHVVSGSGPIRVSYDDRSIGEATVVRRSVEHDLALLSVPGLGSSGARPLKWGDASALRDGDELIALGYAAGLPLSTKVGVVSGQRVLDTTNLIQTDAELNPGMSGGPVLNAEGELVGITVFGFRNLPGLNFAVASSTARTVAE